MNDQLIGDIGYNGKTFSQLLELECCEFLLDKFNSSFKSSGTITNNSLAN